MLTFKTTSHYPDLVVKHLVLWTLADREALDDVRELTVSNTRRGHRGTAWPGIGRVLVRIGPASQFPRDVPPYRRGVPGYTLLDWQECLVALVAHEARHCQQKRLGVSGRGEEADAEHAAIATLFRFRAERARFDSSFAEVVARHVLDVQRKVARSTARAEREAAASTPAALRAAKLASLRARLTRWSSKLERARRAIRKIERSIAYHERAAAKVGAP